MASLDNELVYETILSWLLSDLNNKYCILIEQHFFSDFRKYVSSKSLSRISLRGWPRPRRSRAAGRIQMTPTRQRNCSSSCRNLANGWYLFRGTSRMRTIRRASSRQAASSFLTLYWRNSKIWTPGMALKTAQEFISRFLAEF